MMAQQIKSCVAPRPPIMGGPWLSLALVLSLLLLLLSQVRAEPQPQTYPEEVHRLVVARLRAQDSRGGTWGEWSAWSPCSRSCGRGIATQSRECLMTHRSRTRRQVSTGSRCVGLYKRFQLCNTQECPGGVTDYRRAQCGSFNKTPFNRRFYTWEPYYDSSESCSLNCRAVGLSFYATLNQTVVDGTSCGPDPTSERLCVAGRCMELGCDGVLGSGRLLDECGVCGGDNSTCRVIAGVFSRARMPYGYNLIATLPPGATNITIEQVQPSSNYLSLRSKGGDFFINGNWGVNVSGDYPAAGTVFSYQRPQHFQGDRVMAVGPLHEPVDIMLFYQSNNPGIKYEYRLPMTGGSGGHRNSGSSVWGNNRHRAPIQPPRRPDNPLNPFVPGGPAARAPPSGPVNDARFTNEYGFEQDIRKKEREEEEKKKKELRNKKERKKSKDGKKRRKRYEWKKMGFNPCSKSCGGGVQTMRVACVKRRRGNEVPDKHCAHLPRPQDERKPCLEKPCPAEWFPEKWGPCSVTCGLGVQVRRLACKQRISQDQIISVPEGACFTEPNITKTQVCKLPACNASPSWQVGDWSACSVQCGLGTRTRTVQCVDIRGSVPDHHCGQDAKPLLQELCDMGSCATDTWFFSSWDKSCSEECGSGIQKRQVHCSGDALDNKVTESSCGLDSRPPATRPCTSDRGCGGKWFAGPWSECSEECGPGKEERSVICVIWARGQWRITDDMSNCKSQPRPESVRGCSTPCPSIWYTSQWSECSSSCEGGMQRREVKCLNEKQEPSLDCSSADKPESRQPCNTQSCHQVQGDESSKSKSESKKEDIRLSDSASISSNNRYKNESNTSKSTEVNPEIIDSPGVLLEDLAQDKSPEHQDGYPQDQVNATTSFDNTSDEEKLPNIPPIGSEVENTPFSIDHDAQYNKNLESTSRRGTSVGRNKSQSKRRRRPGSHRRPGRPWRPGPPQHNGPTPATASHQPVESVYLDHTNSNILLTGGKCMDRMKNCHLVYKARLCRLKYYNKLCCETCTTSKKETKE